MLNKQQFITDCQNLTIKELTEKYQISAMTARKYAKQFGVEIKKAKAGRKPKFQY